MDVASFLVGFVAGVVFIIATARYVVGSGTLDRLKKKLRDEEEQERNMNLYVSKLFDSTYGLYRQCDNKYLGTVKVYDDFLRIIEENGISADAMFVRNPDYYSFLQDIIMKVGKTNG